MSLLRGSTSIALTLGFIPCAWGQVELNLTKTIDLTAVTANPLSPSYIGTNPSAVAFVAGDIYVAGFNNSPGASFVGIARKLKTPLAGKDWSAAFGLKAVPASRGYTGLEIEATFFKTTLYAAFDIGATDPDGIAAFDGPTGTKLWNKAARGSSGDALDPGYPGGTPTLGKGLGWTTLLASGRALQNTAGGADIWTTATGMPIVSPDGNHFRDIDFDPATGDIWLREGNNVVHGVRSGDNSLNTVLLAHDSVPDADFVLGQNLAFCATKLGSFVIFNDRSSTSSTQAFDSVLRAIRPDGSSLPIDFNGFTAPLGNGYYDFAFDPKTQSLIVLDFANRKLYQFAVEFIPYITYGHGCAGTGGFVPQLILSGAPYEGGQINISVDKGLPNSVANLVVGLGQAAIPLSIGCTLNVSPVLPFLLGPLPLFGTSAGTGTVTMFGALPAGTAGLTITLQAFVNDPGAGPQGFSNSAGVQMTIVAP